MSNILRFTGKRLKKLHKWEPDVGTQQWVEQNVYMHSDTSPLTGMIRFDDTPYLAEVLADFDQHHVWKQLLNWSTQCGKTLAIQCAWAKSMCTDPARMQWTIKNNKDIQTYLEEKINPFVRGVRVLQEKVVTLSEDKKKKTRAASMNVYGGGVTFTGTTAAERRSKTVKYLFMDEIALYEAGHFLELEGRTKAFERHFRKIMAVSSRKHDGDEMDVNYSTCETKKEWKTYCSECEGYFYAESKHLKFQTKEDYLRENEVDFNLSIYKRAVLPHVHLECPNCEHKITNEEKDQNILDKKYKFDIVDGDEKGRTIGYKVNALAVRITSFETIADLLINAKEIGDIEALEQLYLDYFNEFYQMDVELTNPSDMLLLGNGLPEWQVPEDCYRIYIGVDTQKDHFWASATAFCYDRVPHTLWAGQLQTFSEIEDLWLMAQSLEDTQGNPWMASKMGIDRRGYNDEGVRRTDEVDAFVEYMVRKYKNGDEVRIYATEGHSVLTGDRAVQIINAKDLSSNRTKLDIKILKMSNMYLKNTLSRSITRGIEKANGLPHEGNLFYINQSIIEADIGGTDSKSFTRQMTSESYDYARNPKTGQLDKTKTWIRTHKDNHFWDCAVIAEAFAEMDKVGIALRPMKNDFIKSLASFALDINN